eukprot:gene6763-7860_t
MSQSLGNPGISPLSTPMTPSIVSSSASNSPLPSHHASHVSPNATTPSIFNTQQQQPLYIAPKEISVSCFEFLYIEMVDYIIKSSTDKVLIFKKLDKLGYKVGHKLAERLSIDSPLLPEVLDIVKFICKVFWQAVFRKAIDGLKTNHKGVFVLTDTKFQWLLHLSYDPNSTNKDCSDYVQFAVGLIKGAMANFGHKYHV